MARFAVKHFSGFEFFQQLRATTLITLTIKIGSAFLKAVIRRIR